MGNYNCRRCLRIIVVDHAIVPISWTNRKTGVSKLKIKEMGSRYLFIVLYVWLEKALSRGDYRRKTSRPADSLQSKLNPGIPSGTCPIDFHVSHTQVFHPFCFHFHTQTGVSKLKIKEMGSRYLFIVLYVWLEKILSRGDYRRKPTCSL